MEDVTQRLNFARTSIEARVQVLPLKKFSNSYHVFDFYFWHVDIYMRCQSILCNPDPAAGMFVCGSADEIILPFAYSSFISLVGLVFIILMHSSGRHPGFILYISAHIRFWRVLETKNNNSWIISQVKENINCPLNKITANVPRMGIIRFVILFAKESRIGIFTLFFSRFIPIKMILPIQRTKQTEIDKLSFF